MHGVGWGGAHNIGGVGGGRWVVLGVGWDGVITLVVLLVGSAVGWYLVVGGAGGGWCWW